jgi:hypothetical protein
VRRSLATAWRQRADKHTDLAEAHLQMGNVLRADARQIDPDIEWGQRTPIHDDNEDN